MTASPEPSTQGGKVTSANPVDPTANVLALVKEQGKRIEQAAKLREKRQDDIRQIDQKWGRKLAKSESKWRDATGLAEKTRVDAQFLAQQNAVVVASKEATQTAEALRLQVVGTTTALTGLIDRLSEALEKRLTAVEQNQYQSGGKDLQRSEQRTQGNFNIGQWLYVGGVAVLIAVDLKTRGFI